MRARYDENGKLIGSYNMIFDDVPDDYQMGKFLLSGQVPDLSFLGVMKHLRNIKVADEFEDNDYYSKEVLSHLANDYLYSALLLHKGILADRSTEVVSLYLIPCAYLCKHSVELKLKECLLEKYGRIEQSHSVAKLWSVLNEKELAQYGVIDSFIQELEAMDKNEMALRYGVSVKLEPLQEEFKFDIDMLLVDEAMRFEAAFFESVRVLVVRLTNQGGEKKISLPEMNARINELLKQSIKSDGVINLFSDVNTEFSLFDPKFLEEISKMKEKNLAVELLKKLIAEQVSIYRRTNVVKSEKFSEIMQRAMNSYLNGMLTNEQVIEEMMKLAKQIAAAQKEGEKLGLTADELAFYDALTKPQAIKDFYENEELIAITKELAETLRKNRTIDWQKRDSARAKMRMMIKKLLKKHKYPPEGMDDAVQTVMTQCELWTDNADFS